MIIALISDIHGNLPALKAVLEDACIAKADQIWSLGDLIGYAPFPNECVELIQKQASISIIGNYDQKVICFKQKRSEWKKSKKPGKYDAFAWNNQHLNTESEKYLRSLPKQTRLTIDKYRILLTHGSTNDIEEPVLPETPVEYLSKLGEIADADIIAMGHTHQFMNRKISNQWFINPGSVGLPLKNDLRASYALLKISKDRIYITERKIKYDVSKVIKGLKATGFSENLLKMIENEYEINLRNDSISSSLSPEDIIEKARLLAEENDYERVHSEHVTFLALSLFNELKMLHKLKTEYRLLLNCAGILHDIGWVEGQKGHHKTAMKIILDSENLPFNPRQRKIVALIVRYHRKVLPKDTHPFFSRLSDKDKNIVCVLAGILRIADGLDRTHCSVVKEVECDLDGENILVKCKTAGSATFEFEAAKKKADLLEKVLEKPIRLQKCD